MSEWQPIETLTGEVSTVVLGNKHGAWVAYYNPIYPSGYVPDKKWSSLMLNHQHMGNDFDLNPTHWRHWFKAPE